MRRRAPKRADLIYKEIEAFKDYELIQCVAYEMAVRAPAIQEILIGESYYDKSRPNSEYGMLYPTDKNKEIQKILNDHGLEISEVLNPNKRNPDRQYKTGDIQSFLVQYTRNGLRKTDSHFAKSGISGIRINGEDVFSGERKESDFNKTPNITLYMARPPLRLPTPNKASVDINFSLPLKEIQAQIAHIKNKVDDSDTAIVSPKDLFDSIDYTETEQPQKKPQSQKYADWFFIYDSYQVLKEKRNPSLPDKRIFMQEIDYSLGEHYGEPDKSYYSYDSYRRNILPAMQRYIEDLHYKKLF